MMHLTPTDKMHVLRKRGMHRIVSRSLRRDTSRVMELVRESFRQMVEEHGETRFVVKWREILDLPPEEIGRLLIRRSDRMDWLRDSSPFFRLWGYDHGVGQRIDFQDETIRRRLWLMGKRLLNTSERHP